MTETEFNEEMQTYLLSVEYALTIALRNSGDLWYTSGVCSCPKYLRERKEVLFPEILKKAKETGEDVCDIFHRFQQGLHARNCKKTDE
jgi:hypothetical protein